jgi:D-galactarolactone cycloisomerase
LRITAVRCQRLVLPLDPPFPAAWDPNPRRSFEATIVRVETDAGLVGVGSGDTMNGFEDFVSGFVGRDPLAIARHARALETISFHAGRYWPFEVALWDLLGQASGLPMATLLGGSSDAVPAYASWGSLRDPGQRTEDAHALVEEGFRAVKIRIARERIEEGVAVVAAVRAAIGDALEIMVDLNQWWRMPGDVARGLGPADARRVLERLRSYGVLWVEEPLPGDDVRGMRVLRDETGVRIGGGEMAPTFSELLGVLDADALDVYQPDVVLALGVSGARTLAELALRRNRWFTPHTWTNGIGLLANLHVCAGVGGGPYLEFPYDPPGWTLERRDFMLAEPVALSGDGLVAVPDAPGLGVELDEEAVAFYAAPGRAATAGRHGVDQHV